MTAYGYIRVSTTKQDYSSQKHVLTERFSIDEFVEDTGTGTVIQPNLQKLLDRCLPGDRICVCAIDRLGRSTQNLEAIAEKLRDKQVTLMSARESGVDLLSPAGKLIFQIAGSMAESEAQINADRVRAGLGAIPFDFRRNVHS
jgi:DNA invertase Pin-like site-specific DNA recombinase